MPLPSPVAPWQGGRKSEPLTAARQQCGRQRRLVPHLGLARQIVARDSPGRRLAQHAAAKQRRVRIFAVFRLDIHVLVAAASETQAP